MIDLESYLVNSGIDHRTAGKNVGALDINIKCPYCNDRSHHCGIHKEYLYFYCLRCGEKGSWRKLTHKLLRENIITTLPTGMGGVFLKESDQYLDYNTDELVDLRSHFIEVDIETHKNLIKWVSGSPNNLSEVYRERGVDLKKAIDFGLRLGVDKFKDYAVFYDGNVISARKYYDNKKDYQPKWNKPKGMADNLYGREYCMQMQSEVGYITEGVFDALRFPLGSAVALLGIKKGNSTINAIAEIFSNAKKVMLCLDRDVSGQVLESFALDLHAVGVSVELFNWGAVSYDVKDIDELFLCVGEKKFNELLGIKEKTVAFG